MALLPWHIILSRATAEGIIALATVIGGLIFLMRFIRQQTLLAFGFSIFLFFLTYFLYPGYRVLVPLLLLPVPFLFDLKKRQRFLMIGAIIFFTAVTLLISSTEWGRGRFDQTSMFGNQSGGIVKERISILAQEEGHNQVAEVKIYHNKYIIYTRTFVSQYLSYFSPQYLFLQGGLPYRYTVSDFGLLYWISLPFLILSLLFIRKVKIRTSLYLFYLLVISPFPAPLTLDDVPNVHRTLFMVVPFVLLTAFGFIGLLDNLKKLRIKSLIFIAVLGIAIVESVYFLHMYYDHANAVKSSERGDTNKEVITEVIKQKDSFETVYIPVHDAFPIYYLFFTQNFDSSLIGKIQKNLRVAKIDNIVFSERTSCPSFLLESTELVRNILVLDDGNCKENPRFTEIKSFSRHDGTVSYRFLVPRK